MLITENQHNAKRHISLSCFALVKQIAAAIVLTGPLLVLSPTTRVGYCIHLAFKCMLVITPTWAELNLDKIIYFHQILIVEDQPILRPFIRWAGGKQTLIKHLQKNIPKSDSINKYWEPFLGAGSLFFANEFKQAELSDVNDHLINAYKQIKTSPKLIYDELQLHKSKFDVDYYYQVRSEYNDSLTENNLEQAARFIFLVHTCFNGIYRVNSKGEYNVPIGKLNPSLPTYEHLNAISKKLQSVNIVTRSYADILFDVKEKDFIYLDPPYPKLDEKEQFQQYTIDKFSEKHQIELAEFAYKLRDKGCFVMISNSKVPLIKDLYNKWEIEEVPVVRYINCKKERVKINELIIKNY